jgi:hypothetical protein
MLPTTFRERKDEQYKGYTQQMMYTDDAQTIVSYTCGMKHLHYDH